MSSYNVDKILEQQTPTKRSNPFLTFLLVLYFCFMSLMLLGGMSLASHQVPGILVFLLVGACIGLPLFFREKLKFQWRKRHITAMSMLGALILLIVLGASTAPSSSASSSPTVSSIPEPSAPESTSTLTNLHQVGESFQVGYTQYQVNRIHWQKRVGNEYFGQTADARYLLVNLQVRNLDKEARMIPPFKLVDENGAEYEETADKMYLGSEAPLLKSLNPSVQKKLTLLFDVPPEHHYTLKASGGYWSGEDAQITLN